MAKSTGTLIQKASGAFLGLFALVAGGSVGQAGPARVGDISYNPLASKLGFSGCTENQMQVLNTALWASGSLAAAAKRDLQAVPETDRSEDLRYKTWFGLYSSARYARVTSLYEKIANRAAEPIHFDCTGHGMCNGSAVSCDPGDIAFTCAGGEGQRIWPCPAFWSAPVSGKNSQAGILIREISHWFGTRGNSYDCKTAKLLAEKDPEKAINNGDSWEYFAEKIDLVCE